jgi:RNA polymerase sigma-70 factor (sigma-E family)
MEPNPLCVDSTRSRRVADAGFAELVRATVPVLARKAYLLTGSWLAAEELVQDTLVRLYPQWERVANADVPLAYVQRSLTNNFLNQRRKDGYRELLTDVVPDRLGRPSIEREVTDRDEVLALLRTLNRRQQTVLVLRFYEELSDTEIADHLGCRPGTVRSLASRGLATLRERTQAA